MVDTLDELLQVDKDFAATSVKEGAVAAYKKFLTDDATFLPNRRAPVFGVNNICEAIKIPGVEYTLSWQPENGKVATSGDLGYTWGNYELTYKNDKGRAETEKGKYLNIWVKRDGQWRVTVDMGNITI